MTLPDAADYLGRITGSKPHVSTLWRWCLKGCKGVRLESLCIGGKRYVTASSLSHFVAASTSKQTAQEVTEVRITRNEPPHVTRHNQRRRAEIDAARRRLDELAGAIKPPHRKPRANRSAG